MPKSPRCPSCGARLDNGRTLCPNCGYEVTSAQVMTVCPTCGGRVSIKALTCPFCGAVLRVVQPPRIWRWRRWLLFAAVLLGLGLAAHRVVRWAPLQWASEGQAGATMAKGGGIVALQPGTKSALAVVGLAHAPSATPLPRPQATQTPLPVATPTTTAEEDEGGVSPEIEVTPTPDTAGDVAWQIGWGGPDLEAEEEMQRAEIAALRVPATEQPANPPTPTWTPVPTSTPTAMPTPTSTPVPTPAPRIHTVVRGDTLSGLAVAYDVSLEALLEANGLDEDSILSIGQELIIPGSEQEVPSVSGEGEKPASPGPTAQPTPTLGPTPTPVLYIVQRGDTLSHIAVEFGVSSEEIARVNGISLNSILSLGQELIIPVTPVSPEIMALTPTATPYVLLERPEARTPLPTSTPVPVVTHVVAKGESLGEIAARYGVDAEELARANGIKLKAVIRIGQLLIIPGVTPVPTPTIPATPTAAPSATPTALPVRAPTPHFPYPQPHLLTPANGTVVEGEKVPPLLGWTSVGILAPNEWYRLELWVPSEGSVIEVRTKKTSWRLDEDLYPKGQRRDRFSWRVTVIAEPLVEGQGLAERLVSESSETYTFYWR